MSDTTTRFAGRLPGFMRRVEPSVAIAFACILLLLFLGSLYSSSFLSPPYLLQQLNDRASEFGVTAPLKLVTQYVNSIPQEEEVA